MFACLYLSLASRVDGVNGVSGVSGEERTVLQSPHSPHSPHLPHSPQLATLAKDFSPRVEVHDERTVTLDISGLGSLLGDARAIGDELVRTAEDRGLRLHIAIASTRTAAILLAHARPGLTIIPPGGEAVALALLPIGVIRVSGVSGVSGVTGTSFTCPLSPHLPFSPHPP